MECVHLFDPETSSGFKCRAFPRGIPEGIILGDVEHKRRIEGDHGWQFKSYAQYEREQKSKK
jgi:hypothetical protein